MTTLGLSAINFANDNSCKLFALRLFSVILKYHLNSCCGVQGPPLLSTYKSVLIVAIAAITLRSTRRPQHFQVF